MRGDSDVRKPYVIRLVRLDPSEYPDRIVDITFPEIFKYVDYVDELTTADMTKVHIAFNEESDFVKSVKILPMVTRVKTIYIKWETSEDNKQVALLLGREDIVNRLLLALVRDHVGIAREETLQSVLSAIKDVQPRRIVDSEGTDLSPNIKHLDINLSELLPRRGDVVKELDSVTIGAGGSTSFVKSDLNGYSALIVTVRATFDASATAGVRVRWLYSPDGVNFDSPEEAEADKNYRDIGYTTGDAATGTFNAAGATRQATILVPILAPHVKIEVVNLDSTYGVTVDVWSIPMR